MAGGPTDPGLGVPPSPGNLSPGSEPCSLPDTVTRNGTPRADGAQPFWQAEYALSLLTVLVGLCGLAGNGAVVWLLGFRLRRSPASVYILHLACADFAFLLCSCAWKLLTLLSPHTRQPAVLLDLVWDTSFLAGMLLLVAVSADRCVCVLWPLWYRCRRPARLSGVVCALAWALALCCEVLEHLCHSFLDIPCHRVLWLYEVVTLTTFLVLCVSGLTLLVRVQCGRWGARPARLHATILLNILAFLLLQVPFSVHFLVSTLSANPLYGPLVKTIMQLLPILNSAVNPVIYFFVGRRGRPGRAPLREVLRRALRDEEEGPSVGPLRPGDTAATPAGGRGPGEPQGLSGDGGCL
ncbi:PREDICTED: mas-related G-protein coupled receptor member G [Condylura cristata]|uniref:mas-related G-protein coupled receptor member G n=1 Tax=Condylura cristata TaxID=143302 RepID=UPI0006430FFF|nr:PREDICTED: mas-related G-protein coupled receptor member G [Condylura cristata]